MESLGGMPDGQDVLVSLFSIFSAAGRLACGGLPETMWQRHRVPRHALLPVCRLGFRLHLRPLTIVPAGFQTTWRSAPPLCVKSSSSATMLDSQCLECASPRCARKSAELSPSVSRRTAFLVGVAGLTSAVCLLCAAASLQLLWVAAPLAGFAFGCHWSLMPPLASELFGLRSFATLYCLLQSATTLGTYAFATKLVSTGPSFLPG